MKKQALRTAVITANQAAYQSLGSKIPSNMRRYVYRIRTTNQDAAANKLTIARGPAGSEVAIDYIQAALQYEIYLDPDELKVDAAPIYIFEAVDEYIQVITDVGDMDVFITFADEP